jgi:hypothetical protein
MPKEIFETNSRNGIDDAGYKLQRLLQRNEKSLELDSQKAILPDRDVQANSCLATLHKLDLERPQCLLVRSTADCNDVFAHRSPERRELWGITKWQARSRSSSQSKPYPASVATAPKLPPKAVPRWL